MVCILNNKSNMNQQQPGINFDNGLIWLCS